MAVLFLIDDLMLWYPLEGFVWVLEQIQAHVDRGMGHDEAGLRKKLLELRLLYEMDELDREEYEAESGALMQQLRALYARREEEVADGDDSS